MVMVSLGCCVSVGVREGRFFGGGVILVEF